MTNKILIIRFSSIGDIVLTTPVIRMAKEQIENAEIHFLTKSSFRPILEKNPNIDKLHYVDKNLIEVVRELKKENFSFIIDLHNNLRTARIKRILKRPSKSFNKLNVEKWLRVNFKQNKLPNLHIVDRYLDTLSDFKIVNDKKGLDFFIDKKDEVDLNSLPEIFQKGYIGWVIGGSYFTKMLPAHKVIEIARRVEKPIVLLGGPEDKENGKLIASKIGSTVYNACGKYNLNQSASLVKQAEKILTNDTGLMHIAAAFNKSILSFWGNTIPEFGMHPYFPQKPELSTLVEAKGLACRPCSKLGYKTKCAKTHFHCMEMVEVDIIVDWIEK